MKRIIVAAALALAGLAGPALAQAGHGHSELLSATTPVDDQTVAAPRSISLTFAEAVTLQAVTLRSASGPIPLTFTAPSAPTIAYTIPVPQLAAGPYEVRWSAAHDGETAEGHFHFTVQYGSVGRAVVNVAPIRPAAENGVGLRRAIVILAFTLHQHP